MIVLIAIAWNFTVEQLLRNLRHKAAHGIVLHFAAQHPGSGASEREIVLGAGDAYVGKAPLLFFRLLVVAVERHGAGENAVLHAGDIYVRKLQSLGAVQGHQKDLVLRFICVVQIGNQCHFFQESGQCRFFRGLLVVRNLADKFVDVGDSVLSVLVVQIPQIGLILGLYDDLAQQLGEPVFLCEFAQGKDQLDKGLYFGSAASQGRDIAAALHGGKESDVPIHSVIRKPRHCRGTDAAPGHV